MYIFRLHNLIEPSAALFGALAIVLAHILKKFTQPDSLASLKYGRGQLGSLPFSLLGVYLFCGLTPLIQSKGEFTLNMCYIQAWGMTS